MVQKRAASEPARWELEMEKKRKSYYWEKSPIPEVERHLEKARPVLARDDAFAARSAAFLSMVYAAIRESREQRAAAAAARESKDKNVAAGQ